MIRHLASIAELVDDLEAAATFYRDTLGLTVNREPGANYAVVELPGTLHFGLWPRREAAQAIFGNPERYEELPLGFSIGLEVDDVGESTATLAGGGATILQDRQIEPWKQVTARFLTPGGGFAEIAETPWARSLAQDTKAATEE